MQRASMWLNLYGHQAVRRKPKKGLKLPFLWFQPFFELTFDGLTVILVDSHWCPLHRSILLPQRQICEILVKIAQLLVVVEELSFLSRLFWFFFQFFKILMINLISSKNLGVYKIMRNTVITKLTQQENLKMSFYKLKQAKCYFFRS